MSKRLLLLLWLALSPVLAFAENIHEFKLENGLRVIVQQQHEVACGRV